MIPEQMQRAYELFDRALECPPEERSAFLARACGDHAELRAEVESLLAHDSRVTDDFMRPPESGSASAGLVAAERPDALIGTRIGGFHIRHVIASGGMGTVGLNRCAVASGSSAIRCLPLDHRGTRYACVWPARL